jgi:hypothetical protein
MGLELHGVRVHRRRLIANGSDASTTRPIEEADSLPDMSGDASEASIGEGRDVEEGSPSTPGLSVCPECPGLFPDEEALTDHLESAHEPPDETPEPERLNAIVTREVQSFPEIEEDGLLRVRGRDYRLSSERGLVHVHWPKGEKSAFGEGEWFQFGGRAYRVRHERLESVPSSAILAKFLGEEG